MIPATSGARITLVSGPYWRRTGLWPMGIALCLSWIFVFAWLVFSLWLMQHNWIWATIILCATICFGIYVSFITYKTVTDGYRDYVIELSDSEAVLHVSDRLSRRHSTQMVLLDDVTYAEYYPFPDSASVILHASYADMEIPLWPMSGHAQDVIDFLEGRNVKVVNVLSDDKIPD